jgi:hypothetical protein
MGPETGEVPKKGEGKRQRQWPERIWEAQNHEMHIRHSAEEWVCGGLKVGGTSRAHLNNRQDDLNSQLSE